MNGPDEPSAPAWLKRVTDAARAGELGDTLPKRRPSVVPGFRRSDSTRDAAVLMLFGGSDTGEEKPPADAEVILTHRAPTLRAHSGQVAFPGGGADPEDAGPEGTALREAREEIGLDPGGVRTLAVIPPLFIPVSNFDVRPVLAYWERPHALDAIDPGEVARVMRVPLSQLVEPSNRFVVKHPTGYSGPAFTVDDLVVWGFTGGLLDALLQVSGWEKEWDRGDVRDLGETLRRSANNESGVGARGVGRTIAREAWRGLRGRR